MELHGFPITKDEYREMYQYAYDLSISEPKDLGLEEEAE